MGVVAGSKATFRGEAYDGGRNWNPLSRLRRAESRRIGSRYASAAAEVLLDAVVERASTPAGNPSVVCEYLVDEPKRGEKV